jgi:hypothetical protein
MQLSVRYAEIIQVHGGWVSYRMCPGTRGGGEVSPTRVPLDIGNAIMVCHAKLLDASGPLLLGCVFLDRFVEVEIEVPELQLGLRRRPHGREHDVTSAR